MSHRAVFTIRLFAGFSLPCTHAGMTGFARVHSGAVEVSWHACHLLLCAIGIVSGRREDRKLIAFQLRKLLQCMEAPVSHSDLHPTRSASQGEKSGSRRLLNDAGCTTLPSFFLITNACDGKGYCICSIYPQTLTRQKLFSAATFSPTAIEQNDPSTRFNSPKPPLPPNIKKLMSKFEALD